MIAHVALHNGGKSEHCRRNPSRKLIRIRPAKVRFESSDRHIFGPHFQAFILVLPNDGGVKFHEAGRKVAAELLEENFRLLGGMLEGIIVIAGAPPLAIVPMRHGVDGFILLRPFHQRAAKVFGNLVKGHEGLAAMFAEEAGFADVAREQR